MIDCGGIDFTMDNSGEGLDSTMINGAKYLKNRGVYLKSVYPYKGYKERCKKPEVIVQ